ncbi:hypothetical protein [Paenibacillus aceti]|uniref:Phage protein n=1 Tax=Paenibacillus aceti TaxID=1820010 RepID=A0ABQ1W5Y7_9BACL|nr:hypothetical protein [Paenibacillus aceti]GGG15442.1 hypothetical protein GCM10010913_41690 [Paenibacillus aceti]
MYIKQRNDGLRYAVYYEFDKYYVELINQKNEVVKGFSIPFQSEADAIELISFLEEIYNDGTKNTLDMFERQVSKFEKSVPETVTKMEHEKTIRIIRSIAIEVKETTKK